ncbi:MAG TPA: hypothetical protein VFG53_11330 [Anaeromyxobacter sp.]|nr:hypothetical protein [Anaeromyxobacter sp.]
MRSKTTVRRVLLAAGVAGALGLTAAALPAGSAGQRIALVALTLVKVALLAAAASWSLASWGRLGAGHPAARAWGLVGVSFAAFAVAHVVLGVEQLAYATLPFPSRADAVFTLAQLLLVAALAGFVKAYRSSGLFSEEGARRAGALIVAVATIAGGLLLWTIAQLPVPRLSGATDALYAVLDLTTIALLAYLARHARHLGGRVGRVWALLLAGFAVFSIADVTFGFLDAHDAEPPLIVSQLPFIVAYGLIAAGSRLQLGLLAD